MVKKPKEMKVTLGTNYEINKTLVEQCDNLSEGETRAKIDLMGKYIHETGNKYYMLLCHERRDYTILHGFSGENTCSDMAYTVLECIRNRGHVKAIDQTKDEQAFEIWISVDGESYCYYFFPYDAAVVEV